MTTLVNSLKLGGETMVNILSKIISLLISISFVGCATVSTGNKTVKEPEEYDIYLCENIRLEDIQEGKFKGRKKFISPDNKTNKFIIGDGKKAFIVSHWFDLEPDTNYKFTYKWYYPDGRLVAVRKVTRRVLASDWYTYNHLKLDHKYKHPSGLWSVNIYVNKFFITTVNFLIADNETELAKLEAEHAEQLAKSKPEVKRQDDLKKEQGLIRKDLHLTKTVSQNWAIIVGISKYKYSGKNGLTNLMFADDDAKAFARVLKNLGWSENHIKLLLNEEATQRNILIALESWLTKAGPSDQIVLFWAGHGFPDPEDPEKVYFACYDTDISIPATGYRMDRVRAALEERKSQNVILFADTCHAGKLITRGDRGLSIVPQIDKMRREKNVPKGWIFMVGADTDRKAIEYSSWTNGAFTHCLVKALLGEADGYESVGAKDGIVTMGELRAYLNSAMSEQTQRVLGVAKRPVIATSTGDPDIWNLTLQVK